MTRDATKDQIPLFDLPATDRPAPSPQEKKATVAKRDDILPDQATAVKTAVKKSEAASKAIAKRLRSPVTQTKAAKAVSGLVPAGDVRLTANIRQDLHLKLKIAAAHRRTTIGEIIEELVTKYIR